MAAREHREAKWEAKCVTTSASSPGIDVCALAAELAALIGWQALLPLLDAKQAAILLNVPASWVLAQARAGRIPHIKLGHYTRFDRDELRAWADRRQQGPRSGGKDRP